MRIEQTDPGWQETAEILLRQIGASLTGNMTLHHPVPERCRFPSLGSLQNGKVVFVGYTTMPFGTVDLKFTGVVKTSHIEGGVNVELDSLFCEEHDSATLKMSKA